MLVELSGLLNTCFYITNHTKYFLKCYVFQGRESSLPWLFLRQYDLALLLALSCMDLPTSVQVSPIPGFWYLFLWALSCQLGRIGGQIFLLKYPSTFLILATVHISGSSLAFMTRSMFSSNPLLFVLYSKLCTHWLTIPTSTGMSVSQSFIVCALFEALPPRDVATTYLQ